MHEARMTREVVVGCSVHTGWAVLVGVAVEEASGEPPITVVDRRRVELVPGGERFAYHAAAELDLAAAESLVARVRAEAEASAAAAARELLAQFEKTPDRVDEVVVIGRPPADRPLAEIVTSHTAIHTAEGDLYRTALVQAFPGLAVELPIPRRELLEQVALAVGDGTDRARIDAVLKELGRGLGPPWRKEHKEATLAAWWALAGRPVA